MHQLIHYNMGSKSAIGIGNGICFKQVRDKGGGSYIDPLVRDSIVGLWKFDQNTNESPTRNIIKNTIKDKGGDLELLNFIYKANSGYNGYPEDFTSWNTSTYNVEVSKDGSKVKSINNTRFALQYSYTAIGRDIPSFKVKISNLTEGYIKYFYRNEEGVEEILTFFSTDIDESEIIELPKSHNTVENGIGVRGGFDSVNANIGVTIEQLPLYDGALVTDGKDDMIVSQKTVQEMGITDEITVVSMIHQIGIRSEYNRAFNNYIRNQNVGFIRNNIAGIGIDKTGIYGYTWNNSTKSVINNILGDKNDYSIEVGNSVSIEGKFTVEGYIKNDSPEEVSGVAVYWTFIANKVLTTDEINQIIGYFKLDKYVTPQIIYDVKRQGLTNDTPAADWYLKDFSGNGYDMKLYNYAKKLDSGIGKYAEDFTSWSKTSSLNLTSSGFTIKSVNDFNNANWILWSYLNISPKSFKIRVKGSPNNSLLIYRYQKDGSTITENIVLNKDGVYELPASIYVQNGNGFRIDTMDKSDLEKYIGLSVEQIPDYEGALVSDGKDDYGKAEGLPILKDYTVAADYARLSYGNIDSAIISKSYAAGNGAFGFNLASGQSPNNVSAISFGTGSAKIQADDNYRKIRYQSKYVNNGVTINAGDGIDGNEMWLSCLRENYNFSESALYSILLFPYTLSEFLIERQLKRYKLGTLYPDMVELRPIAKGGSLFKYLNVTTNEEIFVGDYIHVGDTIRFYVSGISGTANEVSSFTVNGVEGIPKGTTGDLFDAVVTKSPQKINITIDEYIRYEDIVQPYPAIINLKQDGKTITWGDKLKVGSDIVFVGSANLLPELYTVSETQYNGVTLYPNTIIKVEKSMVFDNARTYLKANEPSCILSPNRLRIPNSSYKILGYIPDLTGKGNHGRLNNFAYTEDSGVAADGSIKFDGTDDHITIPTLSAGGKCVMMKVNLQSYDRYLYDQRNQWSQYLAIVSSGNTIAYQYSNEGGKTYIDGILNENIIDKDLIGITHNITVANSVNAKSYSPNIGTSFAKGNFANMSLYEFMLFPEIPSEDEIKKLNDVMGIEGGYVESPNYYWDAYGKKNTDTDRNLIADQVSKDVANALEVKNVGYNSESGYTDDNGLLLDGIDDHAVNTVIPAVTDFTVIAKREFLDNILSNNETFLLKGDKLYPSGVGNAFVMEYYYGTSNYLLSFGGSTVLPLETSKISYITPTSYNGNNAIRGNGDDNPGLIIGKHGSVYWKGVFYKLMFYTKTIDQLSINMLKNLFERDELIDVTNPIFKKEEL